MFRRSAVMSCSLTSLPTSVLADHRQNVILLRKYQCLAFASPPPNPPFSGRPSRSRENALCSRVKKKKKGGKKTSRRAPFRNNNSVCLLQTCSGKRSSWYVNVCSFKQRLWRFSPLTSWSAQTVASRRRVMTREDFFFFNGRITACNWMT